MSIAKTLVISCFALLWACVPKESASITTPFPPAGCATLYTYAPGNYIVDIASGEDVILDPAVQDFELFCTQKEAHLALETELLEKRLEKGDWIIYRVEGTPEEIATRADNGKLMLDRMTALIDWEN